MKKLRLLKQLIAYAPIVIACIQSIDDAFDKVQEKRKELETK